MFKQFSIGVLVATVLVLGVIGTALAQDPTPPEGSVCPYGGECGGYGMGGWGYQGTMPALLADALGMTAEELYAALSSGQTVAELAAAQGVELADLVAALLAPQIERLQQVVADGHLTQEQADWMIAGMTEQMAWRLENFGLGYGGGYGSGGCGMMNGGSYGRWGGRSGGYPGGMQGGYSGGAWGGRSGGMRGGYSGGMPGGHWGGSTYTPRSPMWPAQSDS